MGTEEWFGFDSVTDVRSRTKSVLVHLIWGIAGLAVGATVVLLWGKNFSSEWVEAAGTWFGAIATVLALLWAVQTFRADQAHREAERTRRENERHEIEAERAEKERAATRAVEAAAIAEAAQVSLSLWGGSGYGAAPDTQMTSVRVIFANDSDRAVVIDEFRLRAPLELKKLPRLPIRLQANSTEELILDIHPAGAEPHELGGRTLLERFTGTMSYRHGGRAWTRESTGEPVADSQV